MFRTFARRFLPNPLDWMLKRSAKRKAKNVLLCWNRGLGDIALGVAAILHRIRHYLPEATVRVLTRENLKDGFSLLDGIDVIVDPAWKRGEPCDWKKSLKKLNISSECFDLVIDKPSPTDWCQWQHNTLTPRLSWNPAYDALCERFDLSREFQYIGVHVEAETNYGPWRNWPEERVRELFDLLANKGNLRVILFGFGQQRLFSHPNIIDLRGKTTLFELLSIIKNRCSALLAPDSGILSMVYYLNVSFPIRVVTLWADPKHGILKQGVPSSNPELIHIPLIGEHRNLSNISAETVFKALLPTPRYSPLLPCTRAEEIEAISVEGAACVILAGGQGSRLGVRGPKGLFSLSNKTLFQHLVEKIPTSMPIAIMTSPVNHQATVAYFQERENFGRRIHFFEQETVPLLNEKYQAVGMGPNGNGSLYRSLAASGLIDLFEKENIDTLFVSPIENPIANPADGKLLALHRKNECDVTVKCIERKKNESMGALAEVDGKIAIVEYFKVSEDVFLYSFMGGAALSLRFVKKAAELKLPYHWIRKKAMIGGQEISIWKRERLFFDAFHIADKISALRYPRELCYAPIKGPEHKIAIEQLLRKRIS